MRILSNLTLLMKRPKPIWRRLKRRSKGLRNIPRKNLRHRRSNKRTRKRTIPIRSRTEVVSPNKTNNNHRKINSNNRIRARITNSNPKIANHKINRAAVKSNKTRTINLKRRTNLSNRSNKTIGQSPEKVRLHFLAKGKNSLPRLLLPTRKNRISSSQEMKANGHRQLRAQVITKRLRPRQETAKKQAKI